MNPFKKLKLKSQLRNCDYALAGAVIKQQYYDSSKSTVINRLIDDFMDNPCFETAIPLIEYNDMMVFYFTESCDGGLYVRKTSLTDSDTGRFETTREANREATRETTTDTLHKQRDLLIDDFSLDEYNPLVKPSYDPDAPVDDDLSLDAAAKDEPTQTIPIVNDPILEDPKKLAREEQQRRILEESEAWMEQMLSSREPRTKKYPNSKREYERRFYSVESEEREENTPDTIESAYAEEATYTQTDTIKFTPIRDFEQEAAVGIEPEQTDIQSDEITPLSDASFSAVQDTITESSAASYPEKQPVHLDHPDHDLDKFPDRPRSATKSKRSYANVIATLKIDIHTMAKQLEEYRQELSYHPENEQQLVGWINSLEAAIEEFSEVVDLLEDYT